MPGYGAAAPAAPMNMSMSNTPANPAMQTGAGAGGCNATASPAASSESAAAFKELFNQMDANDDGAVDMQEFMKFLQGSMIENGMRDTQANGQTETIDGKTPSSEAAGPAGTEGHGHNMPATDADAEGDIDPMAGSMSTCGAGPAVAPPMATCGS